MATWRAGSSYEASSETMSAIGPNGSAVVDIPMDTKAPVVVVVVVATTATAAKVELLQNEEEQEVRKH